VTIRKQSENNQKTIRKQSEQSAVFPRKFYEVEALKKTPVFNFGVKGQQEDRRRKQA
jgi:hypothetical protein